MCIPYENTSKVVVSDSLAVSGEAYHTNRIEPLVQPPSRPHTLNPTVDLTATNEPTSSQVWQGVCQEMGYASERYPGILAAMPERSVSA